MAVKKQETTSNLISLNFAEALFLLFLGLKLADKIDWSWWWVFAPLWVPIALVVAVVGIMAIFLMVSAIVAKRKEQK